MRISDWSSDVCSSDLLVASRFRNRLATSLGRVSKPRERRAALARPRAGFEQMYSIMENALVAEGVDVRTGATVRGIEVDGGGFLVSTDRGAERLDVVVSTIPVTLGNESVRERVCQYG